jgi:hypothetical protein
MLALPLSKVSAFAHRVFAPVKTITRFIVKAAHGAFPTRGAEAAFGKMQEKSQIERTMRG